MRSAQCCFLGVSLLVPSFASGCLSPAPAETFDAGPAKTSTSEGGACSAATAFKAVPDSPSITYMDDLANHPGCSTAGLATRTELDGTLASYTPAVIPGFACAAKDYGTPENEDTSKPIVILVHGNSSTPNNWETYAKDPMKTPMIAETLVADGYHVYASDARYDLVPADTTNNPSKNYDHGWAVPIVQSLFENLFAMYPNRTFNIAGFSLGPTIVRDALRRMLNKGENPFARIRAIHLASGAHHGVSTYSTLCESETSPKVPGMAGSAACQLGDRTNYVLTPFETPLNGPNGVDGIQDEQSWDTPCSDGNTAYGQTGVCGCNTVVYTTVVFADPTNGPLLDEFVSETASRLKGANNMTVTQVQDGVCTNPSDMSTCTGYFFFPNFEHHFGSIRSQQGIAIAKAALETK
jgi:pimeloyl-ACP methyl ester carboxylesterase